MARIDVEDRQVDRILAVLEDFDSIASQLRRMNKRLDRMERHEEQEAIDLVALTEKVMAGTALDESIKTLVVGIADELATHSDPAVAILADKLRQQAAALSAAVIKNTPA